MSVFKASLMPVWSSWRIMDVGRRGREDVLLTTIVDEPEQKQTRIAHWTTNMDTAKGRQKTKDAKDIDMDEVKGRHN